MRNVFKERGFAATHFITHADQRVHDILGGEELRASSSLLYVVGCPCNSCAPTRAAHSEHQLPVAHISGFLPGEAGAPIRSPTPNQLIDQIGLDFLD